MRPDFERVNRTEVCPSKTEKCVIIGVPVAIRGFAKVGEIVSVCCGPAEVLPGAEIFDANPDAVHKFVVSQKIKVDIPITFGAITEVGKPDVDFDDSECRNCGGGCGCKDDDDDDDDDEQ